MKVRMVSRGWHTGSPPVMVVRVGRASRVRDIRVIGVKKPVRVVVVGDQDVAVSPSDRLWRRGGGRYERLRRRGSRRYRIVTRNGTFDGNLDEDRLSGDEHLEQDRHLERLGDDDLLSGARLEVDGEDRFVGGLGGGDRGSGSSAPEQER